MLRSLVASLRLFHTPAHCNCALFSSGTMKAITRCANISTIVPRQRRGELRPNIIIKRIRTNTIIGLYQTPSIDTLITGTSINHFHVTLLFRICMADV
jgi:hypothetical protein